jgi:hypothetical protein
MTGARRCLVTRSELMAEFFPGTEFRAPVLAVFSAGSLSTHGETTHQPDLGDDPHVKR